MNLKSLVFLSTLIILGISSCSSDDEKKKINSPIIGTWILTSTERTGCTNPESNYYQEEECSEQFCEKIQYRSDGIVIFTDIFEGATDTEQAKFTLTDDTVIACETANDCGDLQTFTIVDNTLTLVSVDMDNGCTTTKIWIKE
jgi:hypothetical protein